MRILDRKFHKHVGRYLFQCALATLARLAMKPITINLLGGPEPEVKDESG